MTTTREIHLVRRPDGMPRPDDFAVVEAPLREPGEGEMTVDNLVMSVDPYMRPRFSGDQALNEALIGGGLGRVSISNRPEFPVGAIVRHGAGMRERFVTDGRGVSLLNPDPGLPLTVYLHALGGTGITAYGGLLEIGRLKEGEQVFVSTAAGAVGSVVAQIAKIKGCRVVGSTGSDDKVRWLLEEAGLDAAINYKTQPLRAALAEAMPSGIDVYFENVGGAHLDAALTLMKVGGRIPVCGMISTYNGGGDPVRGLSNIIYRRVTLQGFVASDFPHLNAQFLSDMTSWLKAGKIKYQETVLEGFERAPEGLIGLFEGRNSGKMLIRVAD